MPILDRPLDALAGAEGLEPVAARAGRIAGRLVPPGIVKDVLSGRQFGHPLHPALANASWIALGAASLVDALGGKGDDRLQRRLLTLGLLTTLPTAASGASDFADTAGAERRVGLAHAVLNVAGISLHATSLVRRIRGRPGGVALSLAGNAVLGVAAHLGGHLAYALGVGVDTTSFASGPVEWTQAGSSGALPAGRPTQVVVEGTAILLVRIGDDVFALADRCTHRGGPLAEGRMDGACITCPWHGSTFSVRDGSCVSGPATRPQPVYETRERDGVIEVRRVEPRALRVRPV